MHESRYLAISYFKLESLFGSHETSCESSHLNRIFFYKTAPNSAQSFFFPSFSVLVHPTYIRGTYLFFLWKIASERKRIIIQLIYWTLKMHVLCLFLLKSFFKTHVSTDSCEPTYRKTSNKKRATCFATLLESELNCYVTRFTTHKNKPCNLICCRTGWNVVGKTRNIVRFNMF